jgi:hypothetical protein
MKTLWKATQHPSARVVMNGFVINANSHKTNRKPFKCMYGNRGVANFATLEDAIRWFNMGGIQ